jgi:hypothetical protein
MSRCWFPIPDNRKQNSYEGSHVGASSNGAEQEPGQHGQGNRSDRLSPDVVTSVFEHTFAVRAQNPNRRLSDFGDAFAQPIHLGPEGSQLFVRCRTRPDIRVLSNAANAMSTKGASVHGLPIGGWRH